MTRTALFLSLAIIGTTLAPACSTDEAARRPRVGGKRTTTDPSTGKALPDFNDPHVTVKEGLPDPFEALLHGQAQTDQLCNRIGGLDDDNNPNFNAVTVALCKDKKTFASMKDLQLALGLDFKKTDVTGTNGSNNNPGFALSSHSSSLLARGTSALNPRAFVFSPPPGKPVRIPGFVVMAFVRGETFVEVAAESPKGGNKLTFYLVKFELDCTLSNSCQNGDLFTPSVEQNWKSWTAYDDEDLKNTLADCRQCHQPDGPSSKMMLRMQEFEDPWTHWFRSDRPGGITLLQDFLRAHGDQEDYGPIPAALIQKSDGRALEDLINGQGFGDQPNKFDSKTIEAEIQRSQSGQPEVNIPRGQSPTWDGLYAGAFNGDFIPPPYHDVKVTDPDKLQYLTGEYKKFMSQGGTLPDMRRVFLDDALEEMTMLPKLNATGREVLVQTCAQCHNPKLDQTISRAKFDATNLDAMTRAEKDLAIARLNLGSGERLRMPPANMRSLPDDARTAAIDELKK
jgi:hypothetical protein